MLLVAAIVLPIATMTALAWMSWRETWRDAERELQRASETVAEYSLRVLEAHRLAADRVNDLLRGLSDAEIRLREQELHQALRRRLAELPLVQTVAVLDRDGYLLLTANVYPVPRDQQFNDREWMSALRAPDAPGTHVSRVYVGRLDGYLFFGVSRRRTATGNGVPENGFDGVINLSVNPNDLSRGFAGVVGDSGEMATLLRTDGRMLARWPGFTAPPPDDRRSPQFHDAVAIGVERRTYLTKGDAEVVERLVAIRRLAEYPIYAVVARRSSAIAARWREQVAAQLAFGVPAALSIVFLAGLALIRARQTERAQAELAATRQALFQSQKMEALGQLTGGIAHDFNNILATIVSSLDLMQRNPAHAPGQRERVNRALQAARSGAELVRQLLVFSRRETLESRPTDINHVVASALAIFKSGVAENVRVEVDLPASLHAALADASHLQAAILNIAGNARDAMPDGGTIRVMTYNCTQATPHPAEGKPRDHVGITIADDGSGMSPDVLARAFEPFFTTKAVGKGTGLGLSTVHSALRQMGGDVQLDSSLGRGTSVHLFLRATMLRPALPVDLAALDEPAAPTLAAMPVLYVEDNALVSLSTIDVLGQAGLTVHAAHDGVEALRLLDARPEINVMITDVGLPGMDGHELAREARRRRPELAILFLSGYDRSRLAGGMLDDQNTLHLSKPYEDADLLSALRRLQAGSIGADANRALR